MSSVCALICNLIRSHVKARHGSKSSGMDHGIRGMDKQQDAAGRPSALNTIRAPANSKSAAPAYVLVEYAPESGEEDLCLYRVLLCADGTADRKGCHSCLDACLDVYYHYRCSRCLFLLSFTCPLQSPLQGPLQGSALLREQDHVR